MENHSTDKTTGLYKTEVLGTRKYSNHPRGCAMAYLLHYMGKFKPELAKSKWTIFKKHMKKKSFGLTGFREYLDTYKGRWTPDSGPIIKGVGVAASGLSHSQVFLAGQGNTWFLPGFYQVYYQVFTWFITRFFPRFQIPGSLGFQ